MTPEVKGFLLVSAAKVLGVFTIVMLSVTWATYLERRIAGWVQDRIGPNRVGPRGLFQPLADGLKNFMKEETLPAAAHRGLFLLAPALSFVPALLSFAVIPLGSPLPLHFDISLPFLGRFVHDGPVSLAVADLPVGFLYILAITSMGVYGIVLAGWASNSKYSLLGGLRSTAQMISYEIAMGMSAVALLLVAGNVTLSEIVARQQASLPFIFPLGIAFFLFLLAAFAETNRLPFDLPEAESELIAGYHAEYSSMKFSMFFIAEYAGLITASALLATLFLGGWDIPIWTRDDAGPWTWWLSLLTFGSFAAKTFVFVFLYMWVRWTLPRFRYDQLMALGWQVMLPLALCYVVVMAGAVYVLEAILKVPFGTRYALMLFGVNLAMVVLLFGVIDRGRVITGVAEPRSTP